MKWILFNLKFNNKQVIIIMQVISVSKNVMNGDNCQLTKVNSTNCYYVSATEIRCVIRILHDLSNDVKTTTIFS